MPRIAQEHFYNKLKEKLLATNLLSSNLIVKASYLKQQEGDNYIKKVNTIKSYLLDKIKQGDGVAYAIYYSAHSKELEHVSRLNDFPSMRDFLLSHEVHNPDNNPYFDPKVLYYAVVLGSLEESEAL